jgi:hypothetical protein
MKIAEAVEHPLSLVEVFAKSTPILERMPGGAYAPPGD